MLVRTIRTAVKKEGLSGAALVTDRAVFDNQKIVKTSPGVIPEEARIVMREGVSEFYFRFNNEIWESSKDKRTWEKAPEDLGLQEKNLLQGVKLLFEL